MKEITLYTVVPQIPERLKPLEEMARNIWFCWNIEAIDLFRSIDSNLWEETRHNPIAMLGRLGRERLEELLDDEGFLLEMDRIHQEIRHYCKARKPYDFGLETPSNLPWPISQRSMG